MPDTSPKRDQFPRERVQATFDHSLPRLRPLLLRQALALTRDRSAAEDVVQATLERALTARERFQAGTSLRGWTPAIMKNLFLDDCRRSCAVLHVVDEVSWNPVDESNSVCDVLALDDVFAALDALPMRDADSLKLAFVEGLATVRSPLASASPC